MARYSLLKVLLILLCSSTVVLIVFFSSNNVLKKNSQEKEDIHTFLEWESNLCHENYILTSTSLKCPEESVVTVELGGRLANQVFEYASVWAVAKVSGLQPFLPRCILKNVTKIFKSLSVRSMEEIESCPVDFNKIKQTRDIPINLDYHIQLPKWAMNLGQIVLYNDQIKDEFVFKNTLLEESQKVLRKVSAKSSNVVFVGVHVRRTDFIKHIKTRYGTPAGKEFYLRAMYYFTNKYKNVIFVIASDDPVWCKKTFQNDNVYVTSPKNSPELDLAILASCNHSIFDYGTYGRLAAILAGGETVFYNEPKYTFTKNVEKFFPDWKTV